MGIFGYPSSDDVGGDEVTAVDIQPRDEAEGEEVVDPPGGPALQELLVEPPVLPEVLPEVEEDAVLPVVEVDLVPADAVRAVVHGNAGRHGTPSLYQSLSRERGKGFAKGRPPMAHPEGFGLKTTV